MYSEADQSTRGRKNSQGVRKFRKNSFSQRGENLIIIKYVHHANS